MKLEDSVAIASAGMKTQGVRIRVAAENLANASSTGTHAGEEPYRRKTVSFAERLDRERQLRLVDVKRYGVDNSAFERRFDPTHPAADGAGYVLWPNVNPLVELMDMREAQRSYEANLNAITLTRNLVRQTLDLLR
ncbi:MAG: flagellar basal body rod protein FlgC [Geminicoccaceae bacterium]|nr:MAG: flagellar basal body rod protein FlgC [Geminicoccaceae bacterium]